MRGHVRGTPGKNNLGRKSNQQKYKTTVMSRSLGEVELQVLSPQAPKNSLYEEVEDHFGCECMIWPFWIQRCSRNVLVLLDPSVQGLASVWSTKAFFGDFVFPQSAEIVLDLTTRFNAIRKDGIGYMYGNRHTNKPIHPIVQAILAGKGNKGRLIPKGTDKPEDFLVAGT